MANRRFGRPRVARRKTDWINAASTSIGIVSVPDGGTRVLAAVAVTEGAASPGTIVRIRGCIHVELAAATAAVGLQMFGIGIGLFDDRAFAVANAAGLPKPILDGDDEKWMWWHCGFVGHGPDLTNPPGVESEGSGRKIAIDIVVDSKAMRKWDENQTLAWVIQNELAQGTATEIEATAFGRLLLKLN